MSLAIGTTASASNAHSTEPRPGLARHGAIQLAQASQTGSASFEILNDVDLPGNDIAGPQQDGRLSGISLGQCESVCDRFAACQAFTYNSTARACFLKRLAGPPQPFRGAVSGRRIASTSAPAGTGSFEILRDTDLPGGDYRSGFNEPGLNGIPLAACQAACDSDRRCAAFTYNAQARVCFLKSSAAAPSRFAGAISGRRIGARTDVVERSPAEGSAAGLSYRPEETEEEHVARIREAAVPYGGPCESERAAIERLAAATTVSAGADTLAAGGRLAIDWTRGPVARGSGPGAFVPAYLMIATDRPVRFEGDDFYVLMPGARAAFGIETFKSGTRAIVPIFGGDMPQTGTIGIEPILAGGLKVETALVGYLRQCQEEVVAATSATDFDVDSAGVPTIVLQQDADLSAPTRRLAAPQGASVTGRTIEVSGDGFRLIEDETGSELARRAGRRPRFSPTGRFVAAQSDDGIEIIDAVDGTVVHKDSIGGLVAWANADSFAVIDRGAWGRIEIIAPLQGGRSIAVGNTACHACGGLDSGVRIDLENDIAVMAGDIGVVAARIGRSEPLLADTWSEPETERATLPNRVRTLFGASQLSVFSLPTQWDIGGVVPFTHVFGSGETPEQAPSLQNLPGVLVEQREVPNETVEVAPNERALELAAWRGLTRTDVVLQRERMVPRLIEFGVPISERDGSATRISSPELLVLSDDGEGYFEDDEREAMADVVARIKTEASAAEDAIVEGTSVQCDAAESEWNETTEVLTVRKIHGEFQKAFRFEIGDRVVWLTHRRCVAGSAAVSMPSLALFDSLVADAAFLEQDTGDPELGRFGSEGICHANVADCDFNLELFDGRHLLFWSAASRAIVVYDLDERRIVFRRYNLPHGDLMADAQVTSDGGGVAQVNSDGTFHLYALEEGRSLLEGRYVDGEVVVWTPNMRFDATAEGAHFVTLKFPGQPGQYTLQQFDSRLRVPGLIEKVLPGEHRFEPLLTGVPPRLVGGLADATGGRVLGSATPYATRPLREVRVYQGGVLTDQIAAGESAETVAIDVDRLRGARWASLVAVDEGGLASLPMGRDLGVDSGGKADMHVLSIGVDRYRADDVPDLGFAVADARRLVRSLADTEDTNVLTPSLMLDDAATPSAILKAAGNAVESAKPGDTIIFFFAGHGLKGPDGRFYMATSAADPDDIAGTALAWDDLARVLAQADARVIVFLDACHSGTAGTDFFATNDDAAQGILRNIPSGLVVFSASKGREVSLENAEIGGGFFTTAVAEVIAADRSRHDTSGNGAIEISELYSGVKRLVVERTDGKQTPWLARNRMIGDFAVF